MEILLEFQMAILNWVSLSQTQKKSEFDVSLLRTRVIVLIPTTKKKKKWKEDFFMKRKHLWNNVIHLYKRKKPMAKMQHKQSWYKKKYQAITKRTVVYI